MIETLLDNDFYQFTMSACLFDNGLRDLRTRYEFRNRTFGVPLASRLSLPVLQMAIEKTQDLRFSDEDVAYLRSLKIFSEEWLTWLPSARLPDVAIGNDAGHLTLTYEGKMVEAIFWETILLSVVNEMYFSRFGDFLSEGKQRLEEKIAYLRERKTLKFVEFGTRRRFSREWQHYVTHAMREEISTHQLLGTSNVALSQQLGLPCVGTMAHQLFMVMTALQRHHTTRRHGYENATSAAIDFGTNIVLHMWAKTYGQHQHMMTALPDTYGTESFVRYADKSNVLKYNRFRQDSGDPVQIGEFLTQYAMALGMEPRIVFSDGLDVRTMSVIEDHFDPTMVSFGWGTDLTNDLGYEPLSIVIKPCAVLAEDGQTWAPCVKISDDVRKATGEPEAVTAYLEAVKGI